MNATLSITETISAVKLASDEINSYNYAAANSTVRFLDARNQERIGVFAGSKVDANYVANGEDGEVWIGLWVAGAEVDVFVPRHTLLSFLD